MAELALPEIASSLMAWTTRSRRAPMNISICPSRFVRFVPKWLLLGSTLWLPGNQKKHCESPRQFPHSRLQSPDHFQEQEDGFGVRPGASDDVACWRVPAHFGSERTGSRSPQGFAVASHLRIGSLRSLTTFARQTSLKLRLPNLNVRGSNWIGPAFAGAATSHGLNTVGNSGGSSEPNGRMCRSRRRKNLRGTNIAYS